MPWSSPVRPPTDGELWLAEDVVGADAAPHDVGVAAGLLIAVLEGGAAVGIPADFPHLVGALDTLDAQFGWKFSGGQRRNEQSQYCPELLALLRGEFLVFAVETAVGFKGRHQAFASSSSRWAKKSSADSCTVVSPAAIALLAAFSPACHC